MQEKTCSKCKKTQPVSEFHRNKTKKDGLSIYCKSCNCAYGRKWYKENTEYALKRIRKWQEENPEKEAERQRKWRKENPGKDAERQRKWREENPGKDAERARKWREENPEKEAERKRRNNHKRRAAVHIPYDFNQAYAEYKGICVVCQEPVPRYEATVEHLYPITKGGKDVLANVGPSHKACNQQKYTKILSFKHVPRDTSVVLDTPLIEV